MYRCDDCGLIFETPHTVVECISKAFPPFERIAVCPDCRNSKIEEYNPNIPKLSVAERLLEALSNLHSFQNEVKKLFGENMENNELDSAVGNITELILEMFPFTDNRTDKQIYTVNSPECVRVIMKALEG